MTQKLSHLLMLAIVGAAVIVLISLGLETIINNLDDMLVPCQHGTDYNTATASCNCIGTPFKGKYCGECDCNYGQCMVGGTTPKAGSLYGCRCPIGTKRFGHKCDLCYTLDMDTTCKGPCQSGYFGAICDKTCKQDLTQSDLFKNTLSEDATICKTIRDNGGICNYCSGHGSCGVTGDCECETNYFNGPNGGCSQTCPLSDNGKICSGHGVCEKIAGVPTCACEYGWRGIDCNLPCPGMDTRFFHTTGFPCNNNGQCLVDYTGSPSTSCNCNQMFRGDACEIECPGEVIACSGHGVCDLQGICSCSQTGGVTWVGEDCSCSDFITCGGNGYCNNAKNIISKCTCYGNWTGDHCRQCKENHYGSDCQLYCNSDAEDSDNALGCYGRGTCTVLDFGKKEERVVCECFTAKKLFDDGKITTHSVNYEKLDNCRDCVAGYVPKVATVEEYGLPQGSMVSCGLLCTALTCNNLGECNENWGLPNQPLCHCDQGPNNIKHINNSNYCLTCESNWFPEDIRNEEGCSNFCVADIGDAPFSGNFPAICNTGVVDCTQCSGHGECSPLGQCLCQEGFTGAECNIQCTGSNGLMCSGHGECKVDELQKLMQFEYQFEGDLGALYSCECDPQDPYTEEERKDFRIRVANGEVNGTLESPPTKIYYGEMCEYNCKSPPWANAEICNGFGRCNVYEIQDPNGGITQCDSDDDCKNNQQLNAILSGSSEWSSEKGPFCNKVSSPPGCTTSNFTNTDCYSILSLQRPIKARSKECMREASCRSFMENNDWYGWCNNIETQKKPFSNCVSDWNNYCSYIEDGFTIDSKCETFVNEIFFNFVIRTSGAGDTTVSYEECMEYARRHGYEGSTYNGDGSFSSAGNPPGCIMWLPAGGSIVNRVVYNINTESLQTCTPNSWIVGCVVKERELIEVTSGPGDITVTFEECNEYGRSKGYTEATGTWHNTENPTGCNIWYGPTGDPHRLSYNPNTASTITCTPNSWRVGCITKRIIEQVNVGKNDISMSVMECKIYAESHPDYTWYGNPNSWKDRPHGCLLHSSTNRIFFNKLYTENTEGQPPLITYDECKAYATSIVASFGTNTGNPGPGCVVTADKKDVRYNAGECRHSTAYYRASSGTPDMSVDAAECQAYAEATSGLIWNRVDSWSHYHKGCSVYASSGNVYFNTQDTAHDCGVGGHNCIQRRSGYYQASIGAPDLSMSESECQQYGESIGSWHSANSWDVFITGCFMYNNNIYYNRNQDPTIVTGGNVCQASYKCIQKVAACQCSTSNTCIGVNNMIDCSNSWPCIEKQSNFKSRNAAANVNVDEQLSYCYEKDKVVHPFEMTEHYRYKKAIDLHDSVAGSFQQFKIKHPDITMNATQFCSNYMKIFDIEVSHIRTNKIYLCNNLIKHNDNCSTTSLELDNVWTPFYVDCDGLQTQYKSLEEATENRNEGCKIVEEVVNVNNSTLSNLFSIKSPFGQACVDNNDCESNNCFAGTCCSTFTDTTNCDKCNAEGSCNCLTGTTLGPTIKSVNVNSPEMITTREECEFYANTHTIYKWGGTLNRLKEFNQSGPLGCSLHYETNSVFYNEESEYREIFNGECSGSEKKVFDGGGDNPCTGDSSDCIERCFQQCKVWNEDGTYTSKGFVVRKLGEPLEGRCWCEAEDSSSCTRNYNAYSRYDYRTTTCQQRITPNETELIEITSGLGDITVSYEECQAYALKNGHADPTYITPIVNVPLVSKGGDPPVPLNMCEGDCDSDADCAGDLICYQKNLAEHVPGCGDGDTNHPAWDYCYMPYPTQSDGTPYNYVAQDPPAPIGMCEGDCDSDADCAGNLKCFQREGDENVLGCDITGAVSGVDICYDSNYYQHPSGCILQNDKSDPHRLSYNPNTDSTRTCTPNSWIGGCVVKERALIEVTSGPGDITVTFEECNEYGRSKGYTAATGPWHNTENPTGCNIWYGTNAGDPHRLSYNPNTASTITCTPNSWRVGCVVKERELIEASYGDVPDLSISKEECQAYANSIGESFHYRSSDNWYPSGCSMYQNNEIYYNEHNNAYLSGIGAHTSLHKKIIKHINVGYTDLSMSASECKLYAESHPDYTWYGNPGSWKDRPHGCVLHSSTNRIFFNNLYTLHIEGQPPSLTYDECKAYATNIGASFGTNTGNPGPGCVVTTDKKHVRYNPGSCRHSTAYYRATSGAPDMSLDVAECQAYAEATSGLSWNRFDSWSTFHKGCSVYASSGNVYFNTQDTAHDCGDIGHNCIQKDTYVAACSCSTSNICIGNGEKYEKYHYVMQMEGQPLLITSDACEAYATNIGASFGTNTGNPGPGCVVTADKQDVRYNPGECRHSTAYYQASSGAPDMSVTKDECKTYAGDNWGAYQDPPNAQYSSDIHQSGCIQLSGGIYYNHNMDSTLDCTRDGKPCIQRRSGYYQDSSGAPDLSVTKDECRSYAGSKWGWGQEGTSQKTWSYMPRGCVLHTDTYYYYNYGNTNHHCSVSRPCIQKHSGYYQTTSGAPDLSVTENECKNLDDYTWGATVSIPGEIKGCYLIPSTGTVYYNTDSTSVAGCNLGSRACIQKVAACECSTSNICIQQIVNTAIQIEGQPPQITYEDCETYATSIGASFGTNTGNPGPGCVVTADKQDVRYNPGECRHSTAYYEATSGAPDLSVTEDECYAEATRRGITDASAWDWSGWPKGCVKTSDTQFRYNTVGSTSCSVTYPCIQRHSGYYQASSGAPDLSVTKDECRSYAGDNWGAYQDPPNAQYSSNVHQSGCIQLSGGIYYNHKMDSTVDCTRDGKPCIQKVAACECSTSNICIEPIVGCSNSWPCIEKQSNSILSRLENVECSCSDYDWRCLQHIGALKLKVVNVGPSDLSVSYEECMEYARSHGYEESSYNWDTIEYYISSNENNDLCDSWEESVSRDDCVNVAAQLYLLYRQRFNGECLGPEKKVFDGGGDNPCTGDSSDCIERCFQQCKAWNEDGTYTSKGFIIRKLGEPQEGRCWCEAEDSSTCTRITGGEYHRYDYRSISLYQTGSHAHSGCFIDGSTLYYFDNEHKEDNYQNPESYLGRQYLCHRDKRVKNPPGCVMLTPSSGTTVNRVVYNTNKDSLQTCTPNRWVVGCVEKKQQYNEVNVGLVNSGDPTMSLSVDDCRLYADTHAYYTWGVTVSIQGEIKGCYLIPSTGTVYYNTDSTSVAGCNLGGRACIEKIPTSKLVNAGNNKLSLSAKECQIFANTHTDYTWYGNPDSWGERPQGCILHTTTNRIFFNSNPSPTGYDCSNNYWTCVQKKYNNETCSYEGSSCTGNSYWLENVGCVNASVGESCTKHSNCRNYVCIGGKCGLQESPNCVEVNVDGICIQCIADATLNDLHKCIPNECSSNEIFVTDEGCLTRPSNELEEQVQLLLEKTCANAENIFPTCKLPTDACNVNGVSACNEGDLCKPSEGDAICSTLGVLNATCKFGLNAVPLSFSTYKCVGEFTIDNTCLEASREVNWFSYCKESNAVLFHDNFGVDAIQENHQPSVINLEKHQRNGDLFSFWVKTNSIIRSSASIAVKSGTHEIFRVYLHQQQIQLNGIDTLQSCPVDQPTCNDDFIYNVNKWMNIKVSINYSTRSVTLHYNGKTKTSGFLCSDCLSVNSLSSINIEPGTAETYYDEIVFSKQISAPPVKTSCSNYQYCDFNVDYRSKCIDLMINVKYPLTVEPKYNIIDVCEDRKHNKQYVGIDTSSVIKHEMDALNWTGYCKFVEELDEDIECGNLNYKMLEDYESVCKPWITPVDTSPECVLKNLQLDWNNQCTSIDDAFTPSDMKASCSDACVKHLYGYDKCPLRDTIFTSNTDIAFSMSGCNNVNWLNYCNNVAKNKHPGVCSAVACDCSAQEGMTGDSCDLFCSISSDGSPCGTDSGVGVCRYTEEQQTQLAKGPYPTEMIELQGECECFASEGTSNCDQECAACNNNTYSYETIPQTLRFSASNSNHFVFENKDDPEITICSKTSITFERTTIGHPLRVVTFNDCKECYYGSWSSLPTSSIDGWTDVTQNNPTTVTFTQPGTYYYVCTSHNQMVGKITVRTCGGQIGICDASRGLCQCLPPFVIEKHVVYETWKGEIKRKLQRVYDLPTSLVNVQPTYVEVTSGAPDSSVSETECQAYAEGTSGLTWNRVDSWSTFHKGCSVYAANGNVYFNTQDTAHNCGVIGHNCIQNENIEAYEKVLNDILRIRMMQGREAFTRYYLDTSSTEENWKNVYKAFKLDPSKYQCAGKPCDFHDVVLLGNLQQTSFSYNYDCDKTCPAVDTNKIPCSGHGRCAITGSCVCDPAKVIRGTNAATGSTFQVNIFDGETIEQSEFIVSKLDQTGYRGEDCSLTCPGYHPERQDMTEVCSGHGVCNIEAVCQCDIGYTGETCQFTCPGFVEGDFNVCSGHGTCAMSEIKIYSDIFDEFEETFDTKSTKAIMDQFYEQDANQPDHSVSPEQCKEYGQSIGAWGKYLQKEYEQIMLGGSQNKLIDLPGDGYFVSDSRVGAGWSQVSLSGSPSHRPWQDQKERCRHDNTCIGVATSSNQYSYAIFRSDTFRPCNINENCVPVMTNFLRTTNLVSGCFKGVDDKIYYNYQNTNVACGRVNGAKKELCIARSKVVRKTNEQRICPLQASKEVGLAYSIINDINFLDLTKIYMIRESNFCSSASIRQCRRWKDYQNLYYVNRHPFTIDDYNKPSGCILDGNTIMYNNRKTQVTCENGCLCEGVDEVVGAISIHDVTGESGSVVYQEITEWDGYIFKDSGNPSSNSERLREYECLFYADKVLNQPYVLKQNNAPSLEVTEDECKHYMEENYDGFIFEVIDDSSITSGCVIKLQSTTILNVLYNYDENALECSSTMNCVEKQYERVFDIAKPSGCLKIGDMIKFNDAVPTVECSTSNKCIEKDIIPIEPEVVYHLQVGFNYSKSKGRYETGDLLWTGNMVLNIEIVNSGESDLSTSEEDCKRYAKEQNIYYWHSSGNWGERPQGCVLHTTTNRLFFNTNPSPTGTDCSNVYWGCLNKIGEEKEYVSNVIAGPDDESIIINICDNDPECGGYFASVPDTEGTYIAVSKYNNALIEDRGEAYKLAGLNANCTGELNKVIHEKIYGWPGINGDSITKQECEAYASEINSNFTVVSSTSVPRGCITVPQSDPNLVNITFNVNPNILGCSPQHKCLETETRRKKDISSTYYLQDFGTVDTNMTKDDCKEYALEMGYNFEVTVYYFTLTGCSVLIQSDKTPRTIVYWREFVPLVELHDFNLSPRPKCHVCVWSYDEYRDSGYQFSQAGCAEGLQCMNRINTGNSVPGCIMEGPLNKNTVHDFCYDPIDINHQNVMECGYNNHACVKKEKLNIPFMSNDNKNLETTLCAQKCRSTYQCSFFSVSNKKCFAHNGCDQFETLETPVGYSEIIKQANVGQNDLSMTESECKVYADGHADYTWYTGINPSTWKDRPNGCLLMKSTNMILFNTLPVRIGSTITYVDSYKEHNEGQPPTMTYDECQNYAFSIGSTFGTNLDNPGPGCVVTANKAHVRYNPGECKGEYYQATTGAPDLSVTKDECRSYAGDNWGPWQDPPNYYQSDIHQSGCIRVEGYIFYNNNMDSTLDCTRAGIPCIQKNAAVCNCSTNNICIEPIIKDVADCTDVWTCVQKIQQSNSQDIYQLQNIKDAREFTHMMKMPRTLCMTENGARFNPKTQAPVLRSIKLLAENCDNDQLWSSFDQKCVNFDDKPRFDAIFFTDKGTTNEKQIKIECQITGNFTARCGLCTCFADFIYGKWAGFTCNTCDVGFGNAQCRKHCPGFDGENVNTMCGGNGACLFGSEVNSENGETIFQQANCICGQSSQYAQRQPEKEVVSTYPSIGGLANDGSIVGYYYFTPIPYSINYQSLFDAQTACNGFNDVNNFNRGGFCFGVYRKYVSEDTFSTDVFLAMGYIGGSYYLYGKFWEKDVVPGYAGFYDFVNMELKNVIEGLPTVKTCKDILSVQKEGFDTCNHFANEDVDLSCTKCEEGWTGKNCRVVCSKCLLGGVCAGVPSEDISSECVCPAGTGSLWEYNCCPAGFMVADKTTWQSMTQKNIDSIRLSLSYDSGTTNELDASYYCKPCPGISHMDWMSPVSRNKACSGPSRGLCVATGNLNLECQCTMNPVTRKRWQGRACACDDSINIPYNSDPAIAESTDYGCFLPSNGHTVCPSDSAANFFFNPINVFGLGISYIKGETYGSPFYGDFAGIIYAIQKNICSESRPCHTGEGHCKSDDQCAGTLKCFIRNSGEEKMAFSAEKIPYNMNYCYHERENIVGCHPNEFSNYLGTREYKQQFYYDYDSKSYKAPAVGEYVPYTQDANLRFVIHQEAFACPKGRYGTAVPALLDNHLPYEKTADGYCKTWHPYSHRAIPYTTYVYGTKEENIKQCYIHCMSQLPSWVTWNEAKSFAVGSNGYCICYEFSSIGWEIVAENIDNQVMEVYEVTKNSRQIEFWNVCEMCESGKYQDETGKKIIIAVDGGKNENTISYEDCRSLAVVTGKQFWELGSSKNPHGCIWKVHNEIWWNTYTGDSFYDCVRCLQYGENSHKVFMATTLSLQVSRTRYEDFESTFDNCKKCPEGKFGGPIGSWSPDLCEICQPGRVTNALDTGCEDCPAGRYELGAVCLQCPNGQYSPQQHAGSIEQPCLNCPVGKDTNGVIEVAGSDDTACTDCRPGLYNEVPGSGCRVCEVGKYKSSVDTDQLRCSDCELLTFANVEGMSACKTCGVDEPYVGLFGQENDKSLCVACNRGEYVSNTTGRCTPCNQGYEQPLLSYQTTCQQCNTGKYAPAAGTSSCIDCEEGRYQSEKGENECLKCTFGKYQSEEGGSSCNDCEAGKFQDDEEQTSCKVCPPGKKQDETGKFECTNCDVGSYQDESGQTTCKACEIGQSQNVGGQASCTVCPTGKKQGQTGQSTCTDCTIMTYQDEEGASFCKPCGAGRYMEGNTEAQTSFDSCVICPCGHKCDGQGGKQICLKGYFAKGEGNTECTARFGRHYYTDDDGACDEKRCNGCQISKTGQGNCEDPEDYVVYEGLGDMGANGVPNFGGSDPYNDWDDEDWKQRLTIRECADACKDTTQYMGFIHRPRDGSCYCENYGGYGGRSSGYSTCLYNWDTEYNMYGWVKCTNGEYRYTTNKPGNLPGDGTLYSRSYDPALIPQLDALGEPPIFFNNPGEIHYCMDDPNKPRL